MRAHPLAPYLDPDEREETLDRLASRAGGRTLRYGTSVDGLPLRAAVVPSAAPSTAPPARLLCTANIHGPELVSSRLALALLERLAEPDAVLERLLRRAELWILPCLNPDGYADTWRREGRGPLGELRTNAHGVDLNRNFPLPGGSRPSPLPFAGSSRPGAATFRGSAPLSEPETAALDRLLAEQGFVASVNLHSFMGTIIPARVKERRDYRAYRTLCRRFSQAQLNHRYLRLANRLLDVFTGELEDHQHHAHHCWAVCVEIMTLRASFAQHLRAPRLFWRFNPRDPRPWIENDLPGVVAFFHAALDLSTVPSSRTR
jgi:predicted deacylase